MIKYNMRYRGPFEYDKFILNVLQFHNEVNMLIDEQFDNPRSGVTTILDLQSSINSEYDKIVGNETKELVGLSENLYYSLIKLKER